jgi:hypothetical protein
MIAFWRAVTTDSWMRLETVKPSCPEVGTRGLARPTDNPHDGSAGRAAARGRRKDRANLVSWTPEAGRPYLRRMRTAIRWTPEAGRLPWGYPENSHPLACLGRPPLSAAFIDGLCRGPLSVPFVGGKGSARPRGSTKAFDKETRPRASTKEGDKGVRRRPHPAVRGFHSKGCPPKGWGIHGERSAA